MIVKYSTEIKNFTRNNSTRLNNSNLSAIRWDIVHPANHFIECSLNELLRLIYSLLILSSIVLKNLPQSKKFVIREANLNLGKCDGVKANKPCEKPGYICRFFKILLQGYHHAHEGWHCRLDYRVALAWS